MLKTIDEAIATGYSVGMFQHEDELRPFCQWLVEQIGPINHVIEIGTLHGGTAALWHELSNGIVITIDLPEGRWGGLDHNYPEKYEERNFKLRFNFSRIFPMTGDSKSSEIQKAISFFLDGEKVDLLFIDGDHSFNGVRNDYLNYLKFVRKGGVIAFHDIADTPMHTRDGVEVHKFFEEEFHEDMKYRWISNGPWGGIGAIVRP